MDGERYLSYTTISQHDEFVYGHFPRHDNVLRAGRRLESVMCRRASKFSGTFFRPAVDYGWIFSVGGVCVLEIFTQTKGILGGRCAQAFLAPFDGNFGSLRGTKFPVLVESRGKGSKVFFFFILAPASRCQMGRVGLKYAPRTNIKKYYGLRACVGSGCCCGVLKMSRSVRFGVHTQFHGRRSNLI